MFIILAALIGLGVGAGGMWYLQRTQLMALKEQVARTQSMLEQEQTEMRAKSIALTQRDVEMASLKTALEHEHRSVEEKLALLTQGKTALLEQAQTQLGEAFKALSADALRQNQTAFLELATAKLGEVQAHGSSDLEAKQAAVEQLVQPIQQTLQSFNEAVRAIEEARAGAYHDLSDQVRGLLESQDGLRRETAKLAGAFRATPVQGQWGELQLRRVIELAGMLEYSDFQVQPTLGGTPRERFRPDVVVRLPGERYVAIDGKAPLTSYLQAMVIEDDAARELQLQESAREVREHMRMLSAKSYWEQFAQTPELVVMFLPEPLYLTALRLDPSLVEDAAQSGVFLASPATLIVLLKAVAHGWQQEQVADNARRISALGRELHDRIAKLAGHINRLGHELRSTVHTYNGVIGALENRVLVTARRFSELGAYNTEAIAELDPVDEIPRAIQSPDVLAAQLPPGSVSSRLDLGGKSDRDVS